MQLFEILFFIIPTTTSTTRLWWTFDTLLLIHNYLAYIKPSKDSKKKKIKKRYEQRKINGKKYRLQQHYLCRYVSVWNKYIIQKMLKNARTLCFLFFCICVSIRLISLYVPLRSPCVFGELCFPATS